jgi:hypothetical protein
LRRTWWTVHYLVGFKLERAEYVVPGTINTSRYYRYRTNPVYLIAHDKRHSPKGALVKFGHRHQDLQAE